MRTTWTLRWSCAKEQCVGIIRGAAKSIIPGSLWRYLSARKHARTMRAAYFDKQTKAIFKTILTTGETHNFTYDLTHANKLYLSETIACVTRRPTLEIASYVDEVAETPHLQAHHFGRRLGWYAIARATKPRVIVETGIERGHGALILCEAIKRNGIGRYYGTDIDPKAGLLIRNGYSDIATVIFGDSIKSLKAMTEPIDLFINDSDHSAEYEAREYQTVAGMLSKEAIILGDNAHVTEELAKFSRQTGRQFLFFQERPKDHWYPGAGIGISFRARM